jgi:hypothetical protein
MKTQKDTRTASAETPQGRQGAGKPQPAQSGGRPRKNALELPVYENLAACSVATGIPLAAIRLAKKSGCSAFERQRVHLGPLLKWIFDPTRDDSVIDYSAEFKKWQALNERLRHEKDSGDVISRTEVATGVSTAMSSLFADLDRLYLTELPPAFKGLDEIGIRDLSLKTMNELKASLKGSFEAIGKEDP